MATSFPRKLESRRDVGIQTSDWIATFARVTAPLTLLLSLFILLSGCSAGLKMHPFDANSGIAALDQIAARRRMLYNSRTTATIQLRSPRGEVHLNYELTIEHADFWRLKLEGPLGVDLGLIELTRNHWEMKDLQAGEVLKGELDDSLYIPTLEITLPPMKYLASLLLPIPDLAYPQEWQIKSADVRQDGTLLLVSVMPGSKERRELALNYAPLQVLQEKIINDGGIITRHFHYKSLSKTLPESADAWMGSWSMEVKYHNIQIYRSTSPNIPVAPL